MGAMQAKGGMRVTATDDQTTEERRLEAARVAVDHSRWVVERRKGITTGIFEAAGIGDWGDTPAYMRSIVFTCRLCRSDASRNAFRRLILPLEARAGRILHQPCPDGQSNYILPLLLLAERNEEWRHVPEEWRPCKGNGSRQFDDLSGYLLGPGAWERYRRSAFHLDPAAAIRTWFGHLGRDYHRTDAPPAPVVMTKRMAFFFLTAPAPYDLLRALRWSQVRGFGGDNRLAKAVDFSRLAWQLWDPIEEEWWAGVIRWLASQTELEPAEVTPIIDFVYAQRYGVPEVELPPLPDFVMKGRSLRPLLRRIAEWHAEIASLRTLPEIDFHPSGVKGGSWEIETDGVTQVWTIDEILTSQDLHEEGKRMRHCVTTYLRSIEGGRSSIFSMKVRRAHRVKRATTIQIKGRKIVQCRGQCNRLPTKDERKVLRLWSNEAGLKIEL